MKTVARILEITGFIASFVALAYSLAHAIDPGACKRIIVGPLGWSISLLTLGLTLGFGAARRDELSKPMQLLFWMFSAVFFTAQADLIHHSDSGSFVGKCENLKAVFTPELRLGNALNALAAFHVDVVHYWMPVVSIISAIAFTITVLKMVMECRRPKSGLGTSSSASHPSI